MMKTFSAAFTVCLICFFATVTFADQTVKLSPEIIAAWKEAAARAGSNGTYVQHYRSSLNGTVTDHFSYKGTPIHITLHITGAVGTNRYVHDKTSPYYQGPDSHGRVGDAGAPVGDAVTDGVSNPLSGYRNLNSVSLCPSPHFRMTEREGCQPVP